MRKQLETYFRAVYPAVSIRTTDEDRAIEAVKAAAKAVKSNVVVWTVTKGAVAYDLARGTQAAIGHPMRGGPVASAAELLVGFLQAKHPPSTVAVIVDVDMLTIERYPMVLRSLRDFIHDAAERESTVVMVSSGWEIPACLSSLVATVDHPLPDEKEIDALIARTDETNSIKTAGSARPSVIQAASGLTATEAENAMAVAVVETGRIDPAVIYREKTAAVRKSGALELVAPDPAGLDGIGGLATLKTWIRKRAKFWSPEAQRYGLSPPRGVLIVGISGGGKSLAAKAMGTALGLPTLRLDMGAIFGMYVGESERRAREALALAEAMAPVILWCDELEKGFTSMASGTGDSGAARRVLQTFLTWMQERKRPVFLVATSNSVAALPPELMRKGRFDEIFTVDLPAEAARAEIFRIHLTRKKRKPEAFFPDMLAALTAGYTGAEIEAAIDDAMVNAFGDGREVESADVVASLEATTPLSITMAEEVEAVRKWGKGRARAAD